MDRLNLEQRQKHEQAVNSCEQTYAATRVTYDACKAALTPLQQQIVERLVEVKFTR